MKCQVDGVEVGAEALSYREMGFGQETDVATYRYEITEDVDSFLLKIRKHYDRCVEELRSDFEQCGDMYPEYLFDLGYPDLVRLIAKTRNIAERFLVEFLSLEVLQILLPKGGMKVEDVRFIVNTVEAIRLTESDVSVVGEAFERVRGPVSV